MMNQIPPQIRFLILLGFIICVVVAGVIFGMDSKTKVPGNLATKVICNQDPMVFVDKKEMAWTGLPLVHQVIQSKGTILRVRSYIPKIVEEKSSNSEGIPF